MMVREALAADVPALVRLRMALFCEVGELDDPLADAALWQATQAASAALRRPGFDGVQPDTAARILRAAEAARRAMKANGNLRLALTVCGMEMAAR